MPSLFGDASMITNIQMALIGIVMVVGVFYVWRALARIEEHIEKIYARLPTMPVMRFAGPEDDDTAFNPEESAMAEQFMNNIFGGIAASAAAHVSADAGAQQQPVVVEELSEEAPAAPATAAATAPPATAEPADHTDAITESDADTAGSLSKGKVRRMNAEALREALRQVGLPTDGTRAVLQERLLEHLAKNI